jgi:hypothetical protein
MVVRPIRPPDTFAVVGDIWYLCELARSGLDAAADALALDTKTVNASHFNLRDDPDDKADEARHGRGALTFLSLKMRLRREFLVAEVVNQNSAQSEGYPTRNRAG